MPYKNGNTKNACTWKEYRYSNEPNRELVNNALCPSTIKNIKRPFIAEDSSLFKEIYLFIMVFMLLSDFQVYVAPMLLWYQRLYLEKIFSSSSLVYRSSTG